MGDTLIDQIILLTGLPYQSVKAELDYLIRKKGMAPENIDLEALREVMADYVREVLIQAKERV